MTTLCVIAAACILVAGLFAVIVERTNERDEARAEAERLALVLSERDAELAHADALITQLAAEAATAPVPFVPVAPVRVHPGGPILRAVNDEDDTSLWPRKIDDVVWLNLYDENGTPR